MYELLFLLMQVALGLLFYWVFEAHAYVLDGTFSFKVWKEKNLSAFIWSFVVVMLLGLISFVDVQGTNYALTFMGYNLEQGGVSGVFLGIAFGTVVKRLQKNAKLRKAKDQAEEKQA